jgi:hypothetical protein
MTTGQNPISVIDHDTLPQSLPVLSNSTINEGDLVFWDSTNMCVRAVTDKLDIEPGKGSLHSAGLLGVAGGSTKPEVYGGDEALSNIPVYAKACVFLNTTAAEKYKHFAFVTVGADAQTVTTVGATEANAVGVVILDPPAAARAEQATPTPEEVEGGSGVRIRVLLIPKHIAAKNI